MRISFQTLLPGAHGAVEAIAQSPIIQQLNGTVWVFAAVEAGHLLFLSVLGGAVLGLNLRLLGLGLTGQAPADLERRLRPLLHIGVLGSIATGLAMGLMNIRTMYPSEAFFIKMVALLAAVLFSYITVREVARGGQGLSGRGKAGTIGGVLIWLFAIVAFTTSQRASPGAILILIAGAALVGAVARRERWLLAGGLIVTLLTGWAVVHGALAGADDLIVARVSVAFVSAAALLVLGVGVRALRAPVDAAGTGARVAAFASTLVWITVAAAGRWIGFS